MRKQDLFSIFEKAQTKKAMIIIDGINLGIDGFNEKYQAHCKTSKDIGRFAFEMYLDYLNKYLIIEKRDS